MSEEERLRQLIDKAIKRYLLSCDLDVHTDIERLDGNTRLIGTQIRLRDPEGNVLLNANSEVYREW